MFDCPGTDAWTSVNVPPLSIEISIFGVVDMIMMADGLALPVMGRRHGVQIHDRYIERSAQLLREGRSSHLMQSCALRLSDEPSNGSFFFATSCDVGTDASRHEHDEISIGSGVPKEASHVENSSGCSPSAKKTLVSRIGSPRTSGHMRCDVIRDHTMTRSFSFRTNMASQITLSRDRDAGQSKRRWL